MIAALKAIFSAPQTIEKAVDKVGKAADTLNFSQQERAELNKETVEGLAQFVKDTATESTDRSITRRYLAIMIIAVYLLISLFIVAYYPFNHEVAKELVKLMLELDLGIAFISVIAFFFGAHMIRGFVAPKNEKKVKE